VRACPTEVFENELYPDEYLLDQAISHLDRSLGTAELRRLTIRCKRAEGPIAGAVAVSCLGTVGENVLFGAAIAGFDEVTLIRGSCAGCHLRPAEDLIRVSVRRARALATAAGLGEISFVTVEREKTTRAPVGRREMFAGLANRVRSGARAISPGGEFRFRENGARAFGLNRDDGAGGSPGRKFLRTVLRSGNWTGDCTVAYDSRLPWARVSVDEDGCTACGACVSVCPTGAFEIVKEGENRFLTFRPSACTNCSLCQEACIEKVIDYEDEVWIADIMQDRAEVIATIKPAWCAICGDVMPANTGKTCVTCERRQVSAKHLRGLRGRE